MEKLEKLYIFVDESGGFEFSQKDTQYLIFTSLTLQNPLSLIETLNKLKHQLINDGCDVEYFHATEDKQIIRNRVYDVLKGVEYEIDSIVVEKVKVNPSLREFDKLYVKIYEILLKYIFNRYNFEKVIIFTDTIPHVKKREAIKKGLKEAIRKHLRREIKFHIFHHSSKSHSCLQAVDYCSWAIYRKWGNRGDIEIRPYKIIKDRIKSEFEIFKEGLNSYY